MADYFVSYTSSDREWAHWIALELEKLGHVAHVHEWEIEGSESIYACMERRHDAADRVLCVVSDEYLKAPYWTLERHAALWQAASKRPGFVLLVSVRPCKFPTLSDHLRRCELFGLAEDAARLRFRQFIGAPVKPEAVAFPGKASAVSNISIRVPEHFLGREDAIAEIDVALKRGEGRVAITTLHGMRGVGKTILAAAYAERHRGDYRATWWISAETPDTMRADLVSLGVRLGWVAADDKEEPALQQVRERVRNEGEGLLLIYDNAIDATSVRTFLPTGGAARALITSNAHAWRGLATPVEIRVWRKEVGADFLAARTGRTDERSEAEMLSSDLEGLPLAHEQAAAYCERLDVSFAEYRRRFETIPARLLDAIMDASADYHSGLTVAKTFALAIDEAAKLHPAAAPLLAYAAELAPGPIPLFFFSDGRKFFGEPLASQLAGDGLDEAVAALRVFALVERGKMTDGHNQSFTSNAIILHRLVRATASLKGSHKTVEDARRVLIEAMCAAYLTRGDDKMSRRRLLNALALGLVGPTASTAQLPSGVEVSAAVLLYALGEYRRGWLDASTVRDQSEQQIDVFYLTRGLFERGILLSEKALGPDHPLVALGLYRLAALLRGQGDPIDARRLLERVVAIHEKTPGHTDAMKALDDLASLLRDQGDLDGAAAIREKLVRLRESQ